AIHCPTDTLTIPEHLLAGEPVALPVKSGGAVFLTRLTQHASLPNMSDGVRWSFDLRFQASGTPTGRDELPALVVRSRANPDSVQDDYQAWAHAWADARTALSGEATRKTHRWDADAPTCA
ncbi:MAG: phytanoyl-CoA dioxygenase, partial [Chloroflexota bacterium]